MSAPVNPRRMTGPSPTDPVLNFRFLIGWGGSVVAGVSNVSALGRTSETIKHREGGSPQDVHPIPGQNEYEPITLERGLITDVAFEEWANKVWDYRNTGSLGTDVSPHDFRRDITIQVRNQAGQVVQQYIALNCWPSQYISQPDLNSDLVVLESMTLQNEGWRRDDSFVAPAPLGR